MFQRAIEIVSVFTHPVIVSKKLHSGTVESGCGAFMFLNSEGWVLTAGHIMQDYQLFHDVHTPELKTYREAVQKIQDNQSLNPKQKQGEIGHLKTSTQWIEKISYWWSRNGVHFSEIAVDPLADLAVAKLSSFDSTSVSAYPTFRNPLDEVKQGTSLCRLGFPFHQIKSSFDTATGSFQLAEGMLPIPRFPLDGICTRHANVVDASSGRSVRFIETSSPGLRGQSGGPIFTSDGCIVGIQSRTIHLPLGFSPSIRQGNNETVEHQFLNVGLGTYVTEVLTFLDNNKIKYSLAPNNALHADASSPR